MKEVPPPAPGPFPPSGLARLLHLGRQRFPALRSRNFRLYWTGQAISLVGTWMQSVAVSWLVWRLTHSPLLLGLVGVCMTLPILAFSLFAGVVADRFVRRRVILTTQTLAMGQAVVLAALVTFGRPHVAVVLALVVVQGLINAFDMPARQSFISETVDSETLPNAIALHSAIFNSARLLGPALAGVVLATLGEAPCFWINAVSYLAVIYGLWRMDLPAREPLGVAGPALERVAEGVRYAWGDVRLRNLLVLLGTAGAIGFQYTILLPVYAGKILNTGAAGYGLLMSVGGVGSLFAALVMTRRQDRWRLRRTLFLGLSTFGVALILFSQSRLYGVSLVLNAVAGFGMILYAASTNTLIQLAVREEFRGRVMSLYTLMFVGTAPAGSFVLGAVAQHFGAPAATIISGSACAVGATWVYFRLRAIARQEAAAAAAAAPAEPAAPARA
jgi:MFS family permease